MISPERIDWVDISKGVCIILVVMMHSVLGTQEAFGAVGWMNPVVEFAAPFRMPDFFLVSGLFLMRRIDAPSRLYLDRKVIHFAYFYVLWLAIQVGLKHGPGAESWTDVAAPFALGLVEPYGTLWFIYALAFFFLLARVTEGLPKWFVLTLAAAAQVAPVETGSMLIDQTASYFVFFYAGYVFAPAIFRLADAARAHWFLALLGLLGWALANHAFVESGIAAVPVVSLLLGFAGGLAIVLFACLVARLGGSIERGLRLCGERSIVIYLAFFIPMAGLREALAKTQEVMVDLGAPLDVGLSSLTVMVSAIIEPLVAYWFIQKIGVGRFLFERPRWATIWPPREKTAVPAAA